MRGKWLLVSGTAIILAIGAGALSVLRKPAAEPPAKAAEAPTAAPDSDEISLTGAISAVHIIPIAAPVAGILDKWEVEVGQEVLEGQLIGHIANSTLESSREQAQIELERAQTRITTIEGQILVARLEASRADADASRATSESARLEKLHQRQQLLLKEGATPRLTAEKAAREYETSREEATTAQALAKAAAERITKLDRDLQLAKSNLEERTLDFEESKEDLDSANLLAPADGMIVKLGAEAGGEVDRNMRDLVQLATDLSILEIAVEPDPKVLERIKPGQAALVLVPDVTSESLSGEVREIKGTQVIVEFASPNPAIRHGTTGSVRIKLL